MLGLPKRTFEAKGFKIIALRKIEILGMRKEQKGLNAKGVRFGV